MGEEPLGIVEYPEESLAVIENDYLIHFVVLVSPAIDGIQEFLKDLEEKHYRPGTERNDLFQIRVFPWKDTLWALISIPKEEE